MKVFAFGLSMAALLATSAVNAQVITTADGNGADTQIRGGNRNNNNYGAGLAPALKWQTNTQSNNRKAYFRFDLTSQSINPASITAAILRFTVENGDNVSDPIDWNFDVFGLNDGAGDNWIEGNLDNSAANPTFINWNNAPGNDTAAQNSLLAGSVTPVGSFVINGVGTRGDVVTVGGASLLSFLQADTNGLVTFIIQRREAEFGANSVVHRLFSKEGAADLGLPGYAPQLTVRAVAPVPEPGTIALMASMITLGGFAARRRARK